MDTMKLGDILKTGEELTSANGLYRVLLQDDGNLVLYQGPVALWSTDTWKVSLLSKPTRAVMQNDGNFVLYSATNVPSWASGTGGTAADHLVLQDDSNLVIYAADGTLVWSRANGSQRIANDTLKLTDMLEVDHERISANGRYRLVMQPDGNLVLYDGPNALWSTNTWNVPAALKPTHAVMQADGNFVLYSATDAPVWQSGSGNKQAERLVVQDDSDIAIYTGAGVRVWAAGVPVPPQPPGPVHAHQRREVGWGKFMETDATLYRDGTLAVTAKTECNNWTSGLRGRLLIVGIDSRGRAVWVSQPLRCTTRGSIPDFSTPSFGTDLIHENWPQEAAALIASLDIYQGDDAIFVDLRKSIVDSIKAVGEIAAALGPVLALL